MRSPAANDCAAPPEVANVNTPPVDTATVPMLDPFFFTVYVAAAVGFALRVPLDPLKFMRLRALQLPRSEGFERLAAPWHLEAGDRLLLGNLATWRRLDDDELVARVKAGQPPIDPESNEYQFSAIVTV